MGTEWIGYDSAIFYSNTNSHAHTHVNLQRNILQVIEIYDVDVYIYQQDKVNLPSTKSIYLPSKCVGVINTHVIVTRE